MPIDHNSVKIGDRLRVQLDFSLSRVERGEIGPSECKVYDAVVVAGSSPGQRHDPFGMHLEFPNNGWDRLCNCTRVVDETNDFD